MMNQNQSRALALVFLLIAATPAPKLPAHPPIPKVAEHAEFTVEVNAKGQVVRVKSAHGTGTKDPFFNLETYGNMLQMFVKHPDGTAEAGLFRVRIDFDPKTRKFRRSDPVLVSRGGSWANEPGAVTVMLQDAQKQNEEQEKRAGKNLPPLHAIVGPTASPTKKP
jgi:hypothetical protein